MADEEGRLHDLDTLRRMYAQRNQSTRSDTQGYDWYRDAIPPAWVGNDELYNARPINRFTLDQMPYLFHQDLLKARPQSYSDTPSTYPSEWNMHLPTLMYNEMRKAPLQRGVGLN